MTEIPRLETERLVLRAPALDDFDAFAAFYASEQADMLGGRLTRFDAWAKFCSLIGQWPLRGFGRWVVADKASDVFLGHLGLHQPEGWPARELAWSVTAAAQGKGVAYEAALAARSYAYDTLGWTRLVSLVTADNARSEALAHRLGARHDGDWTHPSGVVCRMFWHPSPAELATRSEDPR